MVGPGSDSPLQHALGGEGHDPREHRCGRDLPCVGGVRGATREKETRRVMP